METGEDKTLNPKKYFIIITALFGNSQSISPSNSDICPFPDVTFYDNVRAQHELVTKKLNITHLHCVVGWSMGAGQSFQWATQYPDFVDFCVPFCGSAKTSLHNQVFLEGVKSALLAAKGLSSAGSKKGRVESSDLEERKKNRTWSEKERTVGLKAFGRGVSISLKLQLMLWKLTVGSMPDGASVKHSIERSFMSRRTRLPTWRLL